MAAKLRKRLVLLLVGSSLGVCLYFQALVPQYVTRGADRDTDGQPLCTLSRDWRRPGSSPRGINCKSVMEGDETEVAAAVRKLPRERASDEDLLGQLRDCGRFKADKGYDRYPVTRLEEENPIAYSIMLFKDTAQVERLLRAIYRPQNSYCLHVDAKSPDVVVRATRKLASCFDNVFVASRLETVVYSGFFRLQADLNCMADLLARDGRWTYFINLPGQAYPLKTNSEIVKILRIYNGANDIEGITGARMLPNRFRFHHEVVVSPVGKRQLVVRRTTARKSDPPHNLTVVKGSAYGVFSRPFVRFILTDRRAQDFLRWCRDVFSPDEYFWATLNHLQSNRHLNTPGGYSGDPNKKPWLATYASWSGVDPCHGKWIRGVCVFGVRDLPNLISRKELFANKLYYDYQPAALDCLEEWLRNKTFHNNLPFDTYYYRNLPFLKKSSPHL